MIPNPPRAVRAALLLAAASAALGAACAPGADLPRAPAEVPEPAARPVLNVGHRGASAHAPEHTLAAYDLALEMGADFIEQDLQMTRDGVLVVLHDPTLDRTTRGPVQSCTGPVAEKTLAQIRECDAGSWFNERYPERARPEYVGLRIPTLEEVLERYGRRTRYYIETKNPEEAPGMERELLRLLGRHGLVGEDDGRPRVLLQSFSPASLRRIHALHPGLPLVQLFSSRESSRSILGRLDEVSGYATGIGPAKADVDAALVRAAHARCLQVHPYTVNDVREMGGLLALGVDGMFTDRPDRLAALLAGLAPLTPSRPDRRSPGVHARSACRG